jgi:hypothetical protein
MNIMLYIYIWTDIFLTREKSYLVMFSIIRGAIEYREWMKIEKGDKPWDKCSKV